MTCTFFGHRDCPDTIQEDLKNTITDLIVNKGVDQFFVGNHGRFDSFVLHTLKQLKQDFLHIDYCVVLAYLPKNANFDHPTIYPEGIEQVPKRFAISYRNDYMINHSNYVVAYVTHNTGGAHRFLSLAKNRQKICINLFKT